MLKNLLRHKLTLLCGLFLLLQLPLQSIMSINEERQAYRSEAIAQITASSSGSQRLVGPVLVIPYTETQRDYNEAEKKEVVTVSSNQLLLLPESLKVNGELQVEPRKLGIYQSQLYHGELKLNGRFNLESLRRLQQENITPGQPYLSLMVSDARGILQVPALQWGSSTISFQPGSGMDNHPSGVHAPLALNGLDPASGTDFALALTLQGTDHFELVPVGANSQLHLQSNWPHPGFIGNFLPRQRQINDQGFRADWESSWFANNMQARFAAGSDTAIEQLPAFSVNLIEPVDHYQQNERASKYGVLFIGLTFLGFFLFELLKKLRLHPVQYLLVSMAQVIFYLVLLALSEQLGFAMAYLLASVACIGLLSYYASYLLGSGLLFVVLTIVMVLTRKVDWYALGDKEGEKADPKEQP